MTQSLRPAQQVGAWGVLYVSQDCIWLQSALLSTAIAPYVYILYLFVMTVHTTEYSRV